MTWVKISNIYKREDGLCVMRELERKTGWNICAPPTFEPLMRKDKPWMRYRADSAMCAMKFADRMTERETELNKPAAEGGK